MIADVEKIFSGFHIATMAPAGAVLAHDENSEPIFRVPTTPYGTVEDCAIGVAAGLIAWILPLQQLPPLGPNVEIVRGHGRWLTPGLVDCHTHFVYGGNRADEWAARLAGATYQEIARAGGGILSTVRKTREATEDQLVATARRRVFRLAQEGVTTVEIKSGYGLDLESELKMLRAARQLASEIEIRVETTLLAAHAVPPEFSGRADDYVDLVCREIIPAAKGLCSAVDVFCETIAFSVPQSIRIFEAAVANGLKIKVHAEQLSRTGIAVKAAELGALSVDHVEYLSEADCKAICQTKTVASLLPGAFYCLKEKQLPPIAALRSCGVPMAVATDSNPGSSPMLSLLLAGNMACNLFGLTPEEAFTGMTRHAAAALGLGREIGSLQHGHAADFATWDIGSPDELLYHLGHNPCVATYRNGNLRG